MNSLKLNPCLTLITGIAIGLCIGFGLRGERARADAPTSDLHTLIPSLNVQTFGQQPKKDRNEPARVSGLPVEGRQDRKSQGTEVVVLKSLVLLQDATGGQCMIIDRYANVLVIEATNKEVIEVTMIPGYREDFPLKAYLQDGKKKRRVYPK